MSIKTIILTIAFLAVTAYSFAQQFEIDVQTHNGENYIIFTEEEFKKLNDYIISLKETCNSPIVKK